MTRGPGPRRLLLSVFAPALLYGVAEGAILPVLVLSGRAVGSSIAEAAILVVLAGAGSLLMNLPASLLIERLGERLAIAAAATHGCIAAALFLIADGFAGFAIGAFMFGMSGSVIKLARQKYIADAVHIGYRARALSSLSGAMRSGVFAGPFLAAAGMFVFGLPGAYMVGGFVLLLAAVLTLSMQEVPAAALPTGSKRPSTATFPQLIRANRRVFATVGIGVAILGAVRSAKQATIPLWGDTLGLAPTEISLIYGIAGVLDVLLFYPGGRLMDTRGRRLVATVALSIMGAGLIAIPFTTGAVSLAAVGLVLGAGNGVSSGLIMTLGADYAPPEQRARFLGVWRLITDLGVSSGPGIIAVVTSLIALSTAVFTVSAVALVGAVLFLRWLPRDPSILVSNPRPDG